MSAEWHSVVGVGNRSAVVFVHAHWIKLAIQD
jgi:hypothetical protein